MIHIVEIFKISIINIFCFIGIFIVFGLIFSIIENLNNKYIFLSFGKTGVIVTGAIGTFVHELSHLIMCLIFMHKINSVKFFRPIESKNDGVLGYVNHSYKKDNIYQSIGNFFIGIAPIIGGTMIIILLFRILLPDSYIKIIQSIDLKLYVSMINNFNIAGFTQIILDDIFNFVKIILLTPDIYSLRYFIFMFLMYSISTHMSLSSADLKSSLKGLSFIVIIIFAISLIIYLFGLNSLNISNLIVKYNIFISFFMTIGVIFSIVTLIISYIFSLVSPFKNFN
ncbi:MULTISPECIES: hypothetical protein [unclassified Clostridioides]|uniref:hypothetical protein n=1 Tax=unclassified Clostridioides TaxID=2635829 RepID=UPI001D11D254|nr:hypothetical protein [Clostridioides sp. ES-S-0123-01]MCC0679590.1 hypothetical protein [Clostridioides sp. ES-S-0005-03]MCC0695270.1 hypothetical protein [Clostridioides sp. ES-S-0048-02]MCC0707830.1 hypothetical protein [Clostridioides sp. ES-S-0190-01]UDN49304.1 hypothetical protein JJJ25_09690 [Clostridioides sp. ES-S-0173-01]UDN60239.1 hypothetical protein IC758_10230 [Clostridioides sp. ES-W-0016-02]